MSRFAEKKSGCCAWRASRIDGISASVVLTSIRAIGAGEEILIDYGDFAGEAVA